MVSVDAHADQGARSGEIAGARERVAHRNVEVVDDVVARGIERQECSTVFHEFLESVSTIFFHGAAILRRKLVLITHRAFFAPAPAARNFILVDIGQDENVVVLQSRLDVLGMQ